MHLRNSIECSLIVLINSRIRTSFIKSKKDSPDSWETRNDKKWWLPAVKVPPNGFSYVSRRLLQSRKECVNKIRFACCIFL
ncbi:unnamed protein product [Brassica oleracea]|uniref:(rape) hypothetical protein n=1 Tax=Brassica napus TaxID=3708 RepID=A0A816IHY8_BRANA|nr:unnamed protein product [Brassica napus]